MAIAEPGSGSGSVDQANIIGLWEAVARDSASVCGAVNALAWILEEQQELLVLAPLVWEESVDVGNC